jgi:serine/threonine protein kinase
MASLDKYKLTLNSKLLEMKPKRLIRYWMAPEEIAPIRGQVYSAQSDLFSYGIVLYEVAVAQCPYTVEVSSDVRTLGSKMFNCF